MTKFGLGLLAAAASLVALPADLMAQWSRAETPHFVIYSELAPDDLEEFARELELFDGAYRTARGIPEVDLATENKLRVFQVESVSDVRATYGGSGDGIAGFYIPRAEGAVAVVPRLAGDKREGGLDAGTIFFHEYAHHLMYESLNSPMPAWLREGFAEFFGTADVNVKKSTVDLGRAAMHRSAELKYLAPMPIRDMLSDEFDRTDARNTSSIYSYGWVLTHYLTFEKSREGQLDAYVLGLVRGMTPLESAEAAFGNLDVLNGEMKSYAEKSRIPYVKLDVARLTEDRVKVERLSPGFSAAMEYFIDSQTGVDEEEAQEVVMNLRRIAGQYSDDAMVQRALTEAEFDVGDYDRADAAADRAIALDPGLVQVHLYKARIAMARAEDDETDLDNDAVEALFAEAREHIGHARRLSPKDPEGHMLYHESFVREGGRLPQDAMVALITAVKLAPFDRNLRFNAAQLLLSQGNMKDAEILLVPIAFDLHAGTQAQIARAIIDKIRDGDVKGAQNATRNFIRNQSITSSLGVDLSKAKVEDEEEESEDDEG